jgi:branched-chain amino acid transport system permease protein
VSHLLSVGYVIQQFFNALVIGSFYSLLAVSYALVHGLTNRIVLSFGDMAMVGSFSAIYAAIIGLALGLNAPAVVAVAAIGTGVCLAALGVASFNVIFSPLIRGKGQTLLIVSISFGLVLQEIMRLQSGGREQWLEPMLSEAIIETPITGFMVRVSAMQMLIIGAAAALLLMMFAVLRWTRVGKFWRACSEDVSLAALLGIDVRKVTTLSFIAASVYSGAAGVTLAIYYGGVSFYMGLMLGLKALFASIIGGFGTLGGAVTGAFVLAFLETIWATFFPLGYRDVAVFMLILSLLVIRPQGLLGERLRTDYE